MNLPTDLKSLLIRVGDEIPKQRAILIKEEDGDLVHELIRLALVTFTGTSLLMTGSTLYLGAKFTDEGERMYRELTQSR